MDFEDFKLCKKIVRGSVDKLRGDVDKLKAVDDLIGEEATERTKLNLINTIFVLQEVESKILLEMENRLSREELRREERCTK